MYFRRKLLKKILVIPVIFALGVGFGYLYSGAYQGRTLVEVRPQHEKNTPRAFLSESYDKIKENYWEKLTDQELLDMFKNASSALGNPLPAQISGKDELIKKLDKEQALKLVSHVLANLKPQGRSGLFTTKQEVALKNIVENRNPQTGEVEPTIFTKIIGQVLYLQFTKFSPTSLEEFQQAFDTQKDKDLDSLILDLRGNIGGAIDATAHFLGFFLGKGQLAFEFYKKGEFLPFRTPTDKLATISKYKQIVVLIDNNTQSSAEMMAAAFKKYHLGAVLGVPTKGWGSVERVFPLDNQINPSEKYSIFLVHSITLRDDNQPIEGRGVEPDINITDPNWEQQLFSYFRNQELIKTLKIVI